ncbi:MAG: T9SS type A sorting domain-containing protein, partial [Thermoanaerobaculia bacterium]|nr:T9SS type A sorting domain-containing protein [Thermoanaerobaculia bacterium]
SDLVAANASVAINGSLVFSGTGNSRLVCTNGMTAINGQIVYSGGGTTSGANQSNLFIQDNGIYEIARNGSNVPIATWSGNATLKITGMTDNDPAFPNNAVLGNLYWDCPNQTVPAVVNVNLTMSRVDIYDTGTGEIQVSAQNGASQMRTWIVNGDYTQSGGTVNLSSGNNGSGKIIFKGGNFYGSKTLTETSTTGKGILEFDGGLPQTAYFGTLQNTVDVVINTADKVLLNTRLTMNPQTTLTLLSGNLVTSAQNLLTISAGATVIGGSVASHVSGPMRKAGNTAFTFPIGKGTTYAPMAITAPAAVTDTFTAEYFDEPYTNTSNVLPPLVRVSKTEYWQLERTSGTGPVQVTLHWTDGSASGINDLPSLTVARFDGADWTDRGGVASGSAVTGSVQSDPTSQFDWFTFGAKLPAFNPLPVELSSFSATPIRDRVLLNWTTATEKNNAWFVVERSFNGLEYTGIGRVPGAGASNVPRQYTFTDEHPLSGPNYYRLRQTDYDGSFSHSPVRLATVGAADRLLLYPSPARDVLYIRQGAPAATALQWHIFDETGRLLATGTQEAGVLTWEVPVGQLTGGTYLLRVEMDREQLTEWFVKQ